MKETRKKEPVPPRPPLCFRPLRLTWSVVKYMAISSPWRLYRGREWPLSTSNLVKLLWLVNFYASKILACEHFFPQKEPRACSQATKIYTQITVRWVARCIWKVKREWECISDWGFRLPSFELWIPTSISGWVPTSEFRPPNHVRLLSSLHDRRKKENGRGDRPSYKDQAFLGN